MVYINKNSIDCSLFLFVPVNLIFHRYKIEVVLQFFL